MLRFIAACGAAIVAGVLFVAPATADARTTPHLYKTQAHRVAVAFARDVAETAQYEFGLDGYSWWVEPARKATRRVKRRIVDLDAQFTLYDDVNEYALACDYKIRVRKYRDGLEGSVVTIPVIREEIDLDTDCFEVEWVPDPDSETYDDPYDNGFDEGFEEGLGETLSLN